MLTRALKSSMSKGLKTSGRSSVLPRDGLVAAFLLKNGMIDSIGLSISEFYAACPVAHRSIYSADGSAFYDTATIITNIEASAELNDGGELVGSVAKGYAQYADGTEDSVMLRAYRFFNVAYPEPTISGFPYTLPLTFEATI